jgi:hypothetical protein
MSIAPAVRRLSALRRWTIRFFLLAAITVVVVGSFIGWQVYQRFADQRVLQETIADLDARHPRWRLEHMEADRPAVPDEENSANIIRAAAARIRPFESPSPTERTDMRPEPSSPDVALNDEQLRSVIDLVESVEWAIAPTLRLQQFPRGRHSMNFAANAISAPLPHADDVSKIHFRVLRPLLLMHLHEGDGEAAVRDCICTLHLARSMDDEPCFLSQMFRNSIVTTTAQHMERVLGQVTVADAELARIQAKLAEEVARDGWPRYMRADRAAVHRLMAAVARGDVQVSSLRRPRSVVARAKQTLMDDAAEWLGDRYPPRLSEAHAWLLAERTQLLDETASLPWHERTGVVAAIHADRAKAPKLAGHWRDARQILSGFQYKQAVMRCTFVAIAVERHRLRHGDWPASTAELVPAFLPELPLDPFDGKPLHLKRLTDGVVIYSVGVNCTDDGGQIRYLPGQQYPSDIGVRLWDVAHRRQPPPVEEKQP